MRYSIETYIEYYNNQRIVLKNKVSPTMYRQACLHQIKW